MKRILLIALLLVPLSAWADGGWKRPQRAQPSIWEAMMLWQGQSARQEEPAPRQEPPGQQKPKPHKKPPCSRACQANFGEAVNYPPYDLEP